ncbi:hypothetical protein [Janibacter terrae]|uniref:hypothetical protein n=1 Tax=Janibacter terrae TaxID=103817 RepID=UPI003825071C
MSGLRATPDELVNDAIMQWTAKMALLVVEGQTDRTVLSQLLEGDSVYVAVASDKSNALRVVELLGDVSPAVVGPTRVLVDRDDDQGPCEEGRLIRTVGRDLDAEIAAAPDVLLRAVWQSLRCGSRAEAEAVHEKVVRAAHGLRALREVNASRSMGWKLKSIQMKDVLRVDMKRPQEVLSVVGVDPSHPEWEDLQADVSRHLSREPAIASCQGHDLHGLVAECKGPVSRDSVQNQCAILVLANPSGIKTLDLVKSWISLAGLSGPASSLAA